VNHDDTRIYQKTLDLISLCVPIIERMPPGYAFLVDQLRRASSSIALNFSEGCGRSSRADRSRFFGTARASAKEVSAILDVGHRFGVVRVDERERGHDMCDHISAMLYRFR
jgi:four helix bundle protein